MQTEHEHCLDHSVTGIGVGPPLYVTTSWSSRFTTEAAEDFLYKELSCQLGFRGRLRAGVSFSASFIHTHPFHPFHSFFPFVFRLLCFTGNLNIIIFRRSKSGIPHDNTDRLTPLPLPLFFYFFWFSKPEIHAYYSSIVVV